MTTAAAPLPSWVWWLPARRCGRRAALLLTARRRTAGPAPDPALAEVPLQITDLSKQYAKSADRYAVRDLSFRVEKGQVLGLLGPERRGQDDHPAHADGPDHAPTTARSGSSATRSAPARPCSPGVGAFVEGAGFLPHLTGRANLELYWRATGRPAEDARLAEALEIAGLGDALDRAVRTYSQGMRQRLAIAQAMLGLPDLLILDEPTNGLDPPQIREMREVMIRYAAAGRTVIVSSHLLSEVEQTCTHLVVMDRGQLVQAGPVAEIIGSGEHPAGRHRRRRAAGAGRREDRRPARGGLRTSAPRTACWSGWTATAPPSAAGGRTRPARTCRWPGSARTAAWRTPSSP